MRNWARARAAEVRPHVDKAPEKANIEGGAEVGIEVRSEARGETVAQIRRRLVRLIALALAVWAWSASGAAAQPAVIPLTPPLPELTPLLEFVEAPLDKPVVPIPNVKLPGPPESLPALPPAKLVSLPDKVTPPVPSSRMLACAGTWLGVASESYECGVARFREGKYDEAARDFEQAVRLGGDRQDLIRLARYWLGESYWQLGRLELADRAFGQVAQTGGRDGLDVWALQGSGWTALRLGDPARAREAFTRLVAARPPNPLDVYGRFGLAMASYELGRYEEAQHAWSETMARPLPPALARDAAFWYGETLGRVKQYDRATAELGRFVAAGPHPLLETGKLRLGWSLLAGGKYAASAARLREAQGLGRGNGPDEHDWRDAGLALALLGAGDIDGARNAARELSAAQVEALGARQAPVARCRGGRASRCGRRRARTGAAGRRSRFGDSRLGASAQGRQ